MSTIEREAELLGELRDAYVKAGVTVRASETCEGPDDEALDALPLNLRKAIEDPGYEYLILTKQGKCIFFVGAELTAPGWLHLTGKGRYWGDSEEGYEWDTGCYGIHAADEFPWIHVNERGMDIRISQIAAAFDHTTRA